MNPDDLDQAEVVEDLDDSYIFSFLGHGREDQKEVGEQVVFFGGACCCWAKCGDGGRTEKTESKLQDYLVKCFPLCLDANHRDKDCRQAAGGCKHHVHRSNPELVCQREEGLPNHDVHHPVR